MILGPHAELGLMVAPDQAALYLGVALFVRYDQVFAITDGDTAFYRTDAGVDSVDVGSISGAASMSRLQFGLRGRVKF